MKSEYPESLLHIISALNNESTINNDLLDEIIRSANLSENDLAPFYSYNHCPFDSYGRKLLYENTRFKILVMSWKAGDFTAIHNHGKTEWGSVSFFGSTTHRLYKIENEKLVLHQKDIFQNGRIEPVCEDLVHLMGNSDEPDFTTLHIYGTNAEGSNASENSRVFLPEHQKVVTTMGSAYLNMDNELILSEMPFEKIGEEVLIDYFSLIKPFYERNKLINILEDWDCLLDKFISK